MMVNSISSGAVQTNNQWKKLSIAKENNIQDSSSAVQQSEKYSKVSKGNRVISMEDLVGIMESSQNLAIRTSATADTTTAAAATTASSDATTNQSTASAARVQSDRDLSGIDADGDGTISEDEYNSLITKLGIENAPTAEEFFKQYDTNSDGEISSEEVNSSDQMMAPPMGPPPQDDDTETTISSDIDTDGDGTISAEEYDAAMKKMGISDAETSEEFIKQYDTNSDGKVSGDELSAASDASKPPMGPPPEDIQVIPSDVDADGDGTVSTDEYKTLVSKMGVDDALSAEDFFKEYDTNSDGEISGEEIIAGLDKDSQSTTADSTSADSTSNNSFTSDSTSDQDVTAQSISAQYLNRAAKMMNAYEMNYEYMFGTENEGTGSIA